MIRYIENKNDCLPPLGAMILWQWQCHIKQLTPHWGENWTLLGLWLDTEEDEIAFRLRFGIP